MINISQNLHNLVKEYTSLNDPKDQACYLLVHTEKKIADHKETEFYLKSCTDEQLFAIMITTIKLCIEHKGSVQDQENMDTELTDLVLKKLGSNTSSLITGLRNKEEVVLYIVSMIFEELD